MKLSKDSKCLRRVRYGKNKDHEHLAQINLALNNPDCHFITGNWQETFPM